MADSGLFRKPSLCKTSMLRNQLKTFADLNSPEHKKINGVLTK
jgi:hypothetical protein